MKKTRKLLMCLLFLSPLSAHASLPMMVSTGTVFLNVCGEYPQKDMMVRTICDVMVRELATSIWLSYFMLDSEPYCLKKNHTTQQYVYVIRNFLEKNPVYISKPHTMYVKEALSDAFPPPCN